MSETGTSDTPRGTGRRRGLVLAVLLAMLAGAGMFYAVWSGTVPLPWVAKAIAPEPAQAPRADGALAPDAAERRGEGPPAYVAIDPLVISLGPGVAADHLKVSIQVEAIPGRRAAIEATRPRIVDVLNTFLRAVDARDLADPRRMARLRAQMLRRVRLVAPPESVRDLLIQEFVLN